MTALRNFPDAPLRLHAAAPWRWHTPAWLLDAWQAMERYGQRRAAFELEMLGMHREASDPALARQFHAAAAECRRVARDTAPGSRR
jgi:hypothetical protein